MDHHCLPTRALTWKLAPSQGMLQRRLSAMPEIAQQPWIVLICSPFYNAT